MVEGLQDCNASPASSWRLRPRVSRGAAISCILFPRGTLASSTPQIFRCYCFPPLLLLFRLCHSPVYPHDHSLHPFLPSYSHLCLCLRPRHRCRYGFRLKEEGRKFEMTVGTIVEDVVVKPQWSQMSEGQGGKNCIHSDHIRKRHRALRNQLNGEELAVGGGGGKRAESQEGRG